MAYASYVRGPADPYTPPSFLLRFLDNFDNKRLRLRWSQRYDRWCLERKQTYAVQYITTLPQYVRKLGGAIVENDSWVRARDGYVLLRYYDAQPMFNDWTIRELQFTDPWRLGSHKEHALMLERNEEREAERKRRAGMNEIEAIAKDEYEEMVWRGGERVAVPSNYKV